MMNTEHVCCIKSGTSLESPQKYSTSNFFCKFVINFIKMIFFLITESTRTHLGNKERGGGRELEMESVLQFFQNNIYIKVHENK